MSELINYEQVKTWFQRFFGDHHIGRRSRFLWLIRELDSSVSIEMRAPKKCLDVGCGDGTITILLANKYPEWQITGMDVDEREIETAKCRSHLWQMENVDFIQADLLKLNDLISCEDFDLIISLDVLEHVDDDVTFLKTINQLLKLGGTLVLHIPTKDQWHFLKRPYLRPHPDHVRTGYSEEEIIHKLERTDFKIFSITRTIRIGTTLACDINNYLAIYRKRTSLFFLLQLLLLPLLCFLVRFDLLCKNQHGNGIIIKAIKERKI